MLRSSSRGQSGSGRRVEGAGRSPLMGELQPVAVKDVKLGERDGRAGPVRSVPIFRSRSREKSEVAVGRPPPADGPAHAMGRVCRGRGGRSKWHTGGARF
jgi:hypothetical protein